MKLRSFRLRASMALLGGTMVAAATFMACSGDDDIEPSCPAAIPAPAEFTFTVGTPVSGNPYAGSNHKFTFYSLPSGIGWNNTTGFQGTPTVAAPKALYTHAEECADGTPVTFPNKIMITVVGGSADAGTDAGGDSGVDGGPGDGGSDSGTCTGLLNPAGSGIALGVDDTNAVLGDLDKDGKLDAIVVSRGQNKVSVLLGKGDGTFGARTDFATAVNPIGVAIGDLNGDAKLDVVVTSAPNGVAGAVSVLLGNGTGGLGAKADFATGEGTQNVAIADVNADGKLDVVTSNFVAGNASVLLGNGAGGLGGKTDFATVASPGQLVVADVNGDGKPDLLVVSGAANQLSVLLGSGTGTFAAHTEFATDVSPNGLAVGDLNGDGKLDVVTSNSIIAVNPSVMSILLGNGNGTFAAKTSINTGRFPGSVKLVDMDLDGKLDIVASAAGVDQIVVHRGLGTGAFAAIETFSTGVGTGPFGIAIGTLNAGTRPDVFGIMSAVDQAKVLLSCP